MDIPRSHVAPMKDLVAALLAAENGGSRLGHAERVAHGVRRTHYTKCNV